MLRLVLALLVAVGPALRHVCTERCVGHDSGHHVVTALETADARADAAPPDCPQHEAPLPQRSPCDHRLEAGNAGIAALTDVHPHSSRNPRAWLPAAVSPPGTVDSVADIAAATPRMPVLSALPRSTPLRV